MFQFPGFASRFHGMTPLPEPGCPIRISTDLRSCAPPRGFSQLTTSFFASESLGIHRMPLSRFLLILNLYLFRTRLPGIRKLSVELYYK